MRGTAWIVALTLAGPVAAQSPVASYGPWQLYEGGRESYLCGVTISAFLHGQSGRINIFRRRGKPKTIIYVWQGNVMGLGASSGKVTFRFDDGVVVIKDAQVGYSVAEIELSESDSIFRQLRQAHSMTVEVPGFFSLTADLDGLPDGLDAMQRCYEGETIYPPEEYRPLR